MITSTPSKAKQATLVARDAAKAGSAPPLTPAKSDLLELLTMTAGHGFIHSLRSGGKPGGLVVSWKLNEWEAVASATIGLNDVGEAIATGAEGGAEAVVEVAERHNFAIFVALRPRRDFERMGRRGVVVSCNHLFWDESKAWLKAAQAQTVRRAAAEFRAVVRQTCSSIDSMAGWSWPVVLAGDWNSMPGSAALATCDGVPLPVVSSDGLPGLSKGAPHGGRADDKGVDSGVALAASIRARVDALGWDAGLALWGPTATGGGGGGSSGSSSGGAVSEGPGPAGAREGTDGTERSREGGRGEEKTGADEKQAAVLDACCRVSPTMALSARRFGVRLCSEEMLKDGAAAVGRKERRRAWLGRLLRELALVPGVVEKYPHVVAGKGEGDGEGEGQDKVGGDGPKEDSGAASGGSVGGGGGGLVNVQLHCIAAGKTDPPLLSSASPGAIQNQQQVVDAFNAVVTGHLGRQEQKALAPGRRSDAAAPSPGSAAAGEGEGKAAASGGDDAAEPVLNTIPASAKRAFAKTGRLPVLATPPTMVQRGPRESGEGPCEDGGWSGSRWDKRALFTTWVKHFHGHIDHVFAEGGEQGLVPVAASELPSQEWACAGTGGMPSVVQPSDHLPIQVRLRFPTAAAGAGSGSSSSAATGGAAEIVP